MSHNFETNILDINTLIENNTSIFSNFTFIFNTTTWIITLIIAFIIHLIFYALKDKIDKNSFIYHLTRPLSFSIAFSMSGIILVGIFMLQDLKNENQNIIHKNIDNEVFDSLTVKYPLKEIKLMTLDEPTYNIQYEKDGYFESYKTSRYDFVSNKIGLFQINSLFASSNSLIGNNFNKTLINISDNDELFFLDKDLIEKELTRIEKDNNLDLSFIKETLLNYIENELYKLNLTEETFNKMIQKGVDK